MCSKVSDYEVEKKLGEGTFGEVYKGIAKADRKVVALKRIFLHNEKEGFPITALREIRILKSLHNDNVLPLLAMATDRSEVVDVETVAGVPTPKPRPRKEFRAYMVTPYMDHDLAGLLVNPKVKLSVSHIKCYMKQLLEGMRYIHEQGFLHRDIKAANILINNEGILRIADFGLARPYDGPRPTLETAGSTDSNYTAMVVTRWYRPPELAVLNVSNYTTAIDMWGVGCVFGEMFHRRPILPGDSDADQATKIFKLVGSPTEETWPLYFQLKRETIGPYEKSLEQVFSDLDRQSLAMLSGLLTLDPLKRLTAKGALAHDFFKTGVPIAKTWDLPKYEESHELTSRMRERTRAAERAERAEEHNKRMRYDNRNERDGRYDHGGYNQGYNGGRERHDRNDRYSRYDRRDYQQPPYRRGGHVDSRPPYRQHRQEPFRTTPPYRRKDTPQKPLPNLPAAPPPRPY